MKVGDSGENGSLFGIGARYASLRRIPLPWTVQCFISVIQLETGVVIHTDYKVYEQVEVSYKPLKPAVKYLLSLSACTIERVGKTGPCILKCRLPSRVNSILRTSP